MSRRVGSVCDPSGNSKVSSDKRSFEGMRARVSSRSAPKGVCITAVSASASTSMSTSAIRASAASTQRRRTSSARSVTSVSTVSSTSWTSVPKAAPKGSEFISDTCLSSTGPSVVASARGSTVCSSVLSVTSGSLATPG